MYMQSLFIIFLRKTWHNWNKNAWIRSPFLTDITKVILFAANEVQLLDLSCDENLKGKFSDSSLSIFLV